jgi:hypothetical protein
MESSRVRHAAVQERIRPPRPLVGQDASALECSMDVHRVYTGGAGGATGDLP